MILVNSRNQNAAPNSQDYINGAFPPGFMEWPEKGLTFQSNWANWAVGYRFREHLYQSFRSEDQFRELIFIRYNNNAGETIDLLNDFEDNIRAFRIGPDPNAVANDHGNDLPEIRYADILLTRAEALNEISGPNQESIELINQIRNRAGLSDENEISLSDFSLQEQMRDNIFDESKR